MKFVANEGKNVEIEVGNNIYLRHAIKTRFINTNDNYVDVMKEYVLNIYQEGDIISISEKIISLCQNRIVKRDDIKIKDEILKQMIRDNPAGQEKQKTPIILIRKKNMEEEL